VQSINLAKSILKFSQILRRRSQSINTTK